MISRLCHLLRMKQPALPDRGLLFASGATVPTDGTDGYQTGCIFQHTDGNAGSSLYVNEGSVTSCAFNALAVGGDEDVFNVGSFSSLEAGSGIAISSDVPAAATVYGDDNDLVIGDSVYNFRSRILLTVDQAGSTIRAVGAQMKMVDGVDVATGIYTASQGYLELVGTHVSQAGATLSCFDASLEIGTLLTVDASGEACGIHVETTGAGTITNNGTCAAILIDNAAGAAEWPVGIYMPGPDVTTGLRIGDFVAAAATTHGVLFGTDMDIWEDGQLDVLSVFGATDSLLTGSYSAKCGRFRHVVQVSGTLEAEAYGLIGQVVAKTVVFGLYAAGLIGTIESNGGFHAGDGASPSYPCQAGVIGRPSGASITVDAGANLAALAALSNTTGITATAGDYSGVYVSRCQSSCDAFNIGVKVDPLAVDRGIVIGAEEFDTAGTGIVVDGVTLHSGCEFYFDDGGVKLAAGYTEAFRAGYLISTAITGDTDVSCYTSHDYIYLAQNVATRGGVGATWASLLVKAGRTISTTAGLCDFSAFNASVDVPSTAVIGADTWACGLAIGGNLGGTHTGNAAGIRLRVPSAGKWDVGFRIEPTSCVHPIQVGEEAFTTAEYAKGVTCDSDSTHYSAEFYFSDGGVALEAGWLEAFRVGFLVTQAISGKDVSVYSAHDYIYLAADTSTSGGVGAAWASLLVKAGVTITTESGVCDFSAFNASVDIPSTATIGTGTYACGLAIGGNLGGTHTGSAAGIRLRAPSAGVWDYGFSIAASGCTTCIEVLGSTHLFSLPADGTAPVETGDYDVGGGTAVRISILVGGQQYYMLASTAPTGA